MPDEHPLPAELSALEAQLAAFTPADSRLDRDALMYELGYTTALRESGANPQLTLGARGLTDDVSDATLAPGASQGFTPRIAISSLASAAVAACVAVLVTRAVMTPTIVDPAPQIADVANESGDIEIVELVEATEPPARAGGYGGAGYLPESFTSESYESPRRFSQQYRMLALRDSILRGEEIIPSRNESLTNVSYDPPKTARELRAEFLPAREVAPTNIDWRSSGWKWFKQFSPQGETI
ncbi:hypothetical protein [Adhaeretor mobilis]|uniref:Uncharacterized protein n=1 Tax=Adhaeretor mobilis TaxID=1930276 RepID=A0A517MPU7_9BACT|nr:hypothetical protein [Adhaeretor mobilis]QDS96807.1 hypothetical protein HG15A2_00650 [Adhaeretor mobilis]